MSVDAIMPAIEALTSLRGKPVHVSITNANGTVGAWAEFTGWLGQPELDGTRVDFPIVIRGSNDDDRFSVDTNSFESWGERDGRVRLVANGLAILVRAAT